LLFVADTLDTDCSRNTKAKDTSLQSCSPKCDTEPSSGGPDDLSLGDAQMLNELIGGLQSNLALKEQALVTIANKAAFSHNHVILKYVIRSNITKYICL